MNEKEAVTFAPPSAGTYTILASGHVLATVVLKEGESITIRAHIARSADSLHRLHPVILEWTET